MQQLYPIVGIVQNYAWGGNQFIPDLVGKPKSISETYAELWMGTHNRGTAMLENDPENRNLAELIASDPELFLGSSAITKFGLKLPFLFKVLDVSKMLSIQSHPTKKAAIKGFEKENNDGIPLTANHRNYKDDNHKPEVMVALTDFWLLHGFKSIEGISKVLNEVPEFQFLQSHFRDHNIFSLYKYIMRMPQSEVDHLLAPLQKRLIPAFEINALERGHADYWAALAFRDYTKNGHFDRGIFSVYLFNLVHLKPNQGIFQDAGIPHAYLEGVNMELMANSDNVFRGGLTPKHVDVPELLQHLVFHSIEPNILKGTALSEVEKVFSTPAHDFELSYIHLDAGKKYQQSTTEGPQIWIVMEGEVIVKNELQTFIRKRGEIYFVKHASSFEIIASKTAHLFKAGMPKDKNFSGNKN